VDRASIADAIEGARRGDARAIEALFAHFEPRIAAYVARSLGARARRWVGPAEVAQVAVFETLRSLALLPAVSEQELARRLHQTARSRMRDAIRKHRREVGESVLAELDPGRARPAPSTGSVTRADARAHLARLLAELPDELSEAVRLCALEELSFVDAGRRVGLTADAVRKRYDRACSLLARKVAPSERD
jgi:DNA-directed RNA polymerase specialized sigma24 family protein